MNIVASSLRLAAFGFLALSAGLRADGPVFQPAPAPVVPPRSGSSERIDYSHAQTLDGWEGNTAWWSVKDGVFTARSEGDVPTSFLLTKKRFRISGSPFGPK